MGVEKGKDGWNPMLMNGRNEGVEKKTEGVKSMGRGGAVWGHGTHGLRSRGAESQIRWVGRGERKRPGERSAKKKLK